MVIITFPTFLKIPLPYPILSFFVLIIMVKIVLWRTFLISYHIQSVSKKKWDLGFRLVLRCSEVSDQKSLEGCPTMFSGTSSEESRGQSLNFRRWICQTIAVDEAELIWKAKILHLQYSKVYSKKCCSIGTKNIWSVSMLNLRQDLNGCTLNIQTTDHKQSTLTSLRFSYQIAPENQQ